MKRTKLSERALPSYSRGEEIMNMVTHIPGILLGLFALVILPVMTAPGGEPLNICASVLYALSITAVFSVSSVYHGLTTTLSKKVMQVIDHCTIYLLIAGTYTMILVCALRKSFSELSWGLLCFEWACAALAVTLTAIDLKRYSVFSMSCYIGMGWAVIPFWRPVLQVLTIPGFLLLLLGGIAYSVGSILYGLGKRKKWMHSVFHIFVDLGALLQFLSIVLYAI